MRVPTENVKQKMQAGLHRTASETVNAILRDGGPRGFYTGYLTTVVREIPFSFIQFPIYEGLKVGQAPFVPTCLVLSFISSRPCCCCYCSLKVGTCSREGR